MTQKNKKKKKKKIKKTKKKKKQNKKKKNFKKNKKSIDKQPTTCYNKYRKNEGDNKNEEVYYWFNVCALHSVLFVVCGKLD